MNVAVVLAKPEEERAGERGDERDVSERPADKVVTVARRPVEQVMQVGQDEHGVRLYLRHADTRVPRGNRTDLAVGVSLAH